MSLSTRFFRPASVLLDGKRGVSERETQLTRQAVNYIVRIAGEKAKLGRVWPHMLRHSCGFYLAGKGTDMRVMQDYLAHRAPTRVSGKAFEGLCQSK